MTHIYQLPEDVLIGLITDYLPKETPILMMIDQSFYHLIHSHHSLIVIHFQNYQNNQHWTNILYNQHLINWFFFESGIQCQIKSKVCPSFLSNFVTHPNFPKLIQVMEFKKFHPNVIKSAIQNKVEFFLNPFMTEADKTKYQVILGLLEPPFQTPTYFLQCARLLQQTDLSFPNLLNLINVFQRHMSPQSLYGVIVTYPRFFFNDKTDDQLLTLLADICSFTLWFVKTCALYIPNISRRIQMFKDEKIIPTNADTTFFYEMVSDVKFINDFALVIFVMNRYPKVDNLFKNSVVFWKIISARCNNRQTLDYFHQICRFKHDGPISNVKSIETIHFLRSVGYNNFFAVESYDLRLLVQVSSRSFKGNQQEKLATIFVNAIKNGFYHSSLIHCAYSKESAKSLVNFLMKSDSATIRQCCERLALLFKNGFQFFQKLLIRSSILQESILLIHILSRYYPLTQEDRSFAQKYAKTASVKFIEKMLNENPLIL